MSTAYPVAVAGRLQLPVGDSAKRAGGLACHPLSSFCSHFHKPHSKPFLSVPHSGGLECLHRASIAPSIDQRVRINPKPQLSLILFNITGFSLTVIK